MHARKNAGKSETSLELKYCERCGGLWLRPPGSGQIYCTNCFQAIAELPPPSAEAKATRRQRRDDREDYELSNDEIEEIDFDNCGGAA
jgi:Zn-finger nucleic acid-binding protein